MCWWRKDEVTEMALGTEGSRSRCMAVNLKSYGLFFFLCEMG